MLLNISSANYLSDRVYKLTLQQFGQYFWTKEGRLKSGNYQVFLIKQPTKKDWSSVYGKILFNMLYILTQFGFDREESNSLEQDTRNHIEQGENLYLVTDDGLVVAYAIFDFLKRDNDTILYLSGIMVARNYRGKGISNALIQTALKESGAQFLVARTQNPVMYESILKSCGNAFPNLRISIPEDIKEVGNFVAVERLKMFDYDPDAMVSKYVYGACLYGVVPTSGNDSLNGWFVSRVNQINGDAMVVVTKI